MKKDFIDVMKEICNDEGISLQQLSKMLKVTKKELEEYQSGQKKPNLEFMARFCKEFDLSLDYFLQEDFKSLSQNLQIVSNERNKEAIFDSMKGKFITPFLYNFIAISPSGYSTVFKSKPVRPDLNMKQITYEAVVNCDGEIKEIKKYHITRVLKDEILIGRAIKDNKYYLVDVNEKIKSPAFDIIDEIVRQPFRSDLLIGINYEDTSSNDNHKKIKDATLLSKIGVVPIAIFPTNYLDDESEYKEGYRDFVAPELNSKENILNAITNYGVNILELIPQVFFEKGDNFVILMEFIIKYENERTNVDENLLKDEILYSIETLKKYAKWWNHEFEYGGCKNAEHYLFSYFADQTLKDESLAKEILNFYKKIGAIKE